MGSLFSLTLIVLFSLASMGLEAQRINPALQLDLLIRDYAFKSYGTNFRTGTVHTVYLPANFSGIKVDTAKFRCGSLQRYGAQVKEFHLGIGVKVQPCVERVMVITQNLGKNWSSVYYASYDLSGYQIVSPILGLLAYKAGVNVNFSSSFELGILAAEQPITIDFRDTSRTSNLSSVSPLCASFENDGNVTFKNPVLPYVCVATTHGHYGLVVRSPPPTVTEAKGKISLWKVLLGTTVGAALGLSLLGLLLVAMFVKVKKKAKMAELERMAYEEEALQVSMVGHVIRAPTAAGSKTLPTIEHGYLSHPY